MADPAVISVVARLNRFLQAASEQFQGHDSCIARQVSAALRGVQTTPPALAPAQHPACSVLPEMLRTSDNDMTRALAACAGDLHWRKAGFGRLPALANEKLAVTELIGPDALYPVPDLRIGLMIQREGFEYPKHWHAAEELYLILHGTASWAVDDDPPTRRKPGGFVHHKSLQPHRITTETQPVLTLWGWVGDIDGASYSL